MGMFTRFRIPCSLGRLSHVTVPSRTGFWWTQGGEAKTDRYEKGLLTESRGSRWKGRWLWRMVTGLYHNLAQFAAKKLIRKMHFLKTLS